MFSGCSATSVVDMSECEYIYMYAIFLCLKNTYHNSLIVVEQNINAAIFD